MSPSSAEIPALAVRTREVLQRSAAARDLATQREGHVPAALREEVDALADALAAAPTAPALDLLKSVHDEQIRLGAFAVARRRQALLAIRASIARLRAMPSREAIIEAAPAEAARSCGLSRTLLSRIDGGDWVPEILWSTATAHEPAGFRTYLDSARIPLEHMLLETDMARRGRPALVTDARHDVRTHKAIILASGSAAYIAAPIVPGRRAVGFLHCDRLGQDQPITSEDRDNLWMFTEQLAVVLETTALTEQLASVQRAVSRTVGTVGTDLEALRATAIVLGEPRPGTVAATASPTDPPVSRLLLALTERERQVLELMANGATNLDIADTLVISEVTVKTHVRNLLRKLRVDNRSQAVVRYLQASPTQDELG